jgi:cytochrome c peroxidase
MKTVLETTSRRPGARLLAIALHLTIIAGCTGNGGGADDDHHDDDGDDHGETSLDDEVRAAAGAHGMKPNPTAPGDTLDDDALQLVRPRAELGRLLFFDPILSGVQQTSCATCHAPAFAFADGRNIARGTFCTMNADMTQIFCEEPPTKGFGGNLTGPDRGAPLNNRNTPSLFNVALFPRLMWNSRFHFVDDSSTDVYQLSTADGFQFPAPEGLMHTRSLLTAQAHIPPTEAVEMTGDFPRFGQPFAEPAIRNPEVRTTVAYLVSQIAAYRELFEKAYAPGRQLTPLDPEIKPGDPIPYLAIADALAHFQEQDLTFTRAPWDDYLAGNDSAISEDAKRGALLFFGKGKCAGCHGGDMFSDFKDYNIAVPQIGPGTAKADSDDPAYQDTVGWDFGLEEITGERADRFKFRTPPLRGVALTSPYMHSGQFARLDDAIRHHVDPKASCDSYDRSQIEPDMAAQVKLPELPLFDARNPVAVGPGTEHDGALTDREIDLVVEFLIALTDPRMRDLSALEPMWVPSRLPTDVAGPARFPIY